MLHLTSMVCLHVGIHVLFWYIFAMSWLTLWTGGKELSPVRLSAEVFIGIGLLGTFLSILSSMTDGIGFTDAVVPFLPLFGLLVLDVLALIYMRSFCRRQLVCLAQNRPSKQCIVFLGGVVMIIIECFQGIDLAWRFFFFAVLLCGAVSFGVLCAVRL